MSKGGNTYKLYYFNARGRAELARYIFAVAKQDYEDFRFKEGTWPQGKPNARFGVVPNLEVNGKKFAQSSAIAQFLAREFGLYGSNNLESLAVDEIFWTIVELKELLGPMMVAKMMQKDEAKAKALQKEKAESVKKLLENLNSSAKGGFFVGNKKTLADISLYDAWGLIEGFYPEFMSESKELKKVYDQIHALPEIQKWIKSRPASNF